MLPAILVVVGLYFLWDVFSSVRSGFSNHQWGQRFSRTETPRAFWSVAAIEFVLVLIAFGLAAYIAVH